MSSTLRGSEQPLADIHDVALLDLDGVVYVGPDAVPGVPAALRIARERGMHLAFVTNNAARPPDVVAQHLTDLGIEASAEEVITSSQAAARYLAEHLPDGAHVLVIGAVGLDVALRERGLQPVSDAKGRVDAVVQGYSPDLNWAMLAEGAVGINSGVLWVATNVDPTVPSPRGPLPGNGSLVAALRHATGVEPVVTGKPDPTMHRETLLRTGAQCPIVVGDRLDTDIEGANAVGCASLLVFSGVTTPRELLAAPPLHRPTFIGADLAALLVPHPQPQLSDTGVSCGRWVVIQVGDSLELAQDGNAIRVSGGHESCGDGSGGHGSGGQVAPQPSSTPAAARDDASTLDDDALDALRALCAARWEREADSGSGVAVTARSDDDAAQEVLRRLGLD